MQLKGYNVALVDTDPQASARAWNALAADEFFPVYGCDKGVSEKDIRQLEKLADFVVIDGTPRIEKSMADAIRLSNFILIPLSHHNLIFGRAKILLSLCRPECK